MNFTEEQVAFRDSVRRMVERHVAPIAAEIDENDRFPEELITVYGDMGLLQLWVPEEYGGPGANLTMVCIAREEISRVSESCALMAGMNTMFALPIMHFGTDEQKQRFLPLLAEGRTVTAIAISEPDCGSDVGGMRTRAVRDGDHYVLNGIKTFISNANHAHSITVLASTDRSAGKRGISAFLLDTTTPGFKVTRTMPTMGWMDDSLCEISFTDCRIPAENLLGEEGRGLSYAMSGLNEGRLNVGCQALGPAQIALDETIEHAKTRVTFGQALGEHQAIQHMIADMAMDLHAARMVLFEAVWRAARGEDARMKASMVKVICTEAACRIADKALQIFGGSGYCRGTIVERVYRDLRVLRIYEGASEIHRNMIAKQLLA